MAQTLPLLRNLAPKFYVDPAVFQAERQAIFARHWHMLGPVSQVAEPGQYLAVEAANWKLFVLCGRDGVLRGFHNVCRHRGARLLEEGAGRCDVLRCPYHLWLYDQEGRLKKAPWFGADPAFRVEDWPLERIAVDTWRGLLFVAIDPATSLLDQLGDLPEEVAEYPIETFQAAADQRFLMRSNWKTATAAGTAGLRVH